MAKVELIVPLVAAQGKADELKQQMTSMLAPTHAEPGCEFYRAYESETPGKFFFHELWESQKHLDAHMESPHLKAFAKAIQELVSGGLNVEKVKELG